MKERDPGHIYELGHLEGDGKEILTFVKHLGGSASYAEEYPGTTSQEVLRALIARTKFVDGIEDCIENQWAIEGMRKAIWQFEARAWRRRQQHMARKAGKHFSGAFVPFGWEHIEDIPSCLTCKHIYCDEHEGGSSRRE
jgi:hypothetical protein